MRTKSRPRKQGVPTDLCWKLLSNILSNQMVDLLWSASRGAGNSRRECGWKPSDERLNYGKSNVLIFRTRSGEQSDFFSETQSA